MTGLAFSVMAGLAFSSWPTSLFRHGRPRFSVMAGLAFSSRLGLFFRHGRPRFFVMAGLDPAIRRGNGRACFFVMAGLAFSSWPGLTRPSVAARAAIDSRVKPGHDA
jgi:hypothetical protein